MRRSPAIKAVLILLLLLTLALAPRLAAGYADLRHAEAALASRPDEASRYYESAAERLWLPRLLEDAARAALTSGDAGRAVQLFIVVEKKGALSLDGYITMGDAYVALNQRDAALVIWEALRNEGHASVALYSRLAESYETKGDFGAALEAWQALLALEADDAHALYRLGLITLSGDPAQGLSVLIQAAGQNATLDETVQ